MIEIDPHDRIDLTGPWAGFSFLGDRLITPEGRELLPEDLAWLSLTACQAQEWRRMMELARGSKKRPFGSAAIVDLAEAAQRRAKRSSGAGVHAGMPTRVVGLPSARTPD